MRLKSQQLITMSEKNQLKIIKVEILFFFNICSLQLMQQARRFRGDEKNLGNNL